MECLSCGRTNGPNARFCGGCGKPLASRCPACGATSERDAQFCEGCGAALSARSPDDAVARKIVTIVFADIVGSTSLHERLDAESVRGLMDRYYRVLHAAVDAHGGTVVKLLGDGVMAAFGVPRVAEDDAIRAVRAAVDMQQAFRAFAQTAAMKDVGLRVAVNTGEVVVSDDQTDVVGDPVNVAARLQAEARDGDVLIGESTQRLVREITTLAPYATLSLKGRSEAVAAYRVVSLDRPTGAPASAFVGREDELRRLMTIYNAAVGARSARLAAILGSPGLGKSRLIAELARRLGDRATVLNARCDSAGGATFAPVAGALRTFLRLDDGTSGDALRAAIDAALAGDESDRGRIVDGIAALLGGTPASPEETFFVIRRLLAALAATQPVVLAIDDLQWAEALLLDLTEHLVQWSTEVPLLVLVAARPELREMRSSLAVHGSIVTEVITLAGLDAGAATRLAASIVGTDELPAAIAGRVLATSEGNPLFVGELVRMLVHDGAIKREGDRWTAGVELATLEMPPTIQALLAARLERLRADERIVLERAAVVGRHFSRTAVAHLLPRDAVAGLDACLESLRRSELIEPDTGWLLGDPVLRFHHVLIRDAAYRRLLKSTRAELHGRFADWLESRVGNSIEHDESIGWHLEQAHQHLRELGPLDAQGRAVGERASRYLAAAGRRALSRDDVSVAAGLLARALDGLDSEDPGRADLALDWCEAALAAGDVGRAAAAIDELGRFTPDSPRLRAWHTCFAGQRAVLTDPQSLKATGDAVAAAATELAAAGDAAGEAKAHWVHAIALGRLGKVGACEAALDRALAAARRAHDRRRANAVLAGAPLAALWGPSPVTRASGRCLDVVRVLRITQGAPAVEAVALRCQAVLEALRGRTDAARRMITSARRMVEELGITQRLLEADVFAGLIELIESDAVAAERRLRAAYHGLRDEGLRVDAAQAAALLGRALLAQGRAAEAETLSHESEALAGDDLKAAIAWRGVRAEALASRGEHASAIDFARAAVDLAAATDALLDHADACLALAAALRASGERDAADAEEARAIELWEAKGATLLAERARRDLGRIAPAARTEADRVAQARPARRRVRPNDATATVARVNAAFAVRDGDALAGLLSASMEFIDHTATHGPFDRQSLLSHWRRLLRADNLTFHLEPLATLGESLTLFHMSLSARGVSGGSFDVGDYEYENLGVLTVDAEARLTRYENFSVDQLGDAVAALYERHTSLLPDGPSRERAAATARSVAALPLQGPPDIDQYFAAISPTLAFADYRIEALGPGHGAQAYFAWVRSLFEVADDVVMRTDDVIDLRPDALLVRWTNSGTERLGGGAQERHLLMLWVFGSDGLITCLEQFADESEDEARARFDVLATQPVAVQRSVRPNAATRNTAGVNAAIAARDAETLTTLVTDRAEVVDHTTGVTYGRSGWLATWRSLLRAASPVQRFEPLATLGDSLALCRGSTSASGFAGGTFDVGAYEIEVIHLVEVDGQGRCERLETFAAGQLDDAVARLYERYGELLPDGPARERAVATARSVAVMSGPYDPDRYAEVFAPTIESIDHRPLATWTARGAEALLLHFRSWREVAGNFTLRADVVVCVEPDGLLLHRTFLGTALVGGGGFERRFVHLSLFGADGRLTRIEFFDVDCAREALARFHALRAEPLAARAPRRRVRPNAATASAASLDAAIAAKDTEAVESLFADRVEELHHPTGAAYDRRGVLAGLRSWHKVKDLAVRHEPLATLGDTLALCRLLTSASAFSGARFDVGACEKEEILLAEVDAHGRRTRGEIFAADRLGVAVLRIYERYAELLPEGPSRDRATATARSVAALPLAGPFDIDRYASAFAPGIEAVDLRTVGFGSLQGAAAVLQSLHAFRDLVESPVGNVDDILALSSDALLVCWTSSGTLRMSGGAFERPLLLLWVFGTDGLVVRWEQSDVDREDEALARFDELAAERSAEQIESAALPCDRVDPVRAVASRVRANAATANAARFDAAFAARDADAFSDAYADEGVEMVDHPTGAVFDREGALYSGRALLRAENPMLVHEPLATLGDSLALCRTSTSASAFTGRKFDVGAYERREILLFDVDADGRRRRTEVFAVDRLGEAVARLYARYAELLPDAASRARAAGTARTLTAMMTGPYDPERSAAPLTPDIESVDHRTLGTWSARGVRAVRANFRSLLEVADDIVMSVDELLALRSDALLTRWTHSGTDRASGGVYERPFLMLYVFASDGRVLRIENFDVERREEALARFDEVTEPSSASRPQPLTG